MRIFCEPGFAIVGSGYQDPPDNRYNDDAYVLDNLKRDYYPVQLDPRYGDLVLLVTSSNTVVHSAIFIADDRPQRQALNVRMEFVCGSVHHSPTVRPHRLSAMTVY